MNLDHLYYFKALVETGSRNDTARIMSITQPTLSLAISKLEKELGVSLVEKKKGAVELTKDRAGLLRGTWPRLCTSSTTAWRFCAKQGAQPDGDQRRRHLFGAGRELVEGHLSSASRRTARYGST
ncbi:MAG: LysR family transcriptional regulator [Eggerthellaceae bacterium]